ncbi:formate dehydrogenase [Hydrogenophaga sp.]|uniref:formate dehydrogenase n=1 Tax=Hydrogenophaga sp. TaxID=1904254 RepID=UPI000EDA07A2|nr:formate dehydrogenase [Hydrogenophaga sp.]RJP72195.1 MAG: formate dehydrogenase [Comamonadaceae bacterium]
MNKSPRSTPEEGRPSLNRRTLFAGASTVGALAAAATLIPRVSPEETAAVEPRPAPTKGGGYSLSEHVKQYYQTTRI